MRAKITIELDVMVTDLGEAERAIDGALDAGTIQNAIHTWAIDNDNEAVIVQASCGAATEHHPDEDGERNEDG